MQRHSNLHCFNRFWCSRELFRLSSCLSALHNWFCHNGLALNSSKSESILFSTRQRLHNFPTVSPPSISGSTIQISETIKILGVTLDNHLALKLHTVSLLKYLLPYQGAQTLGMHRIPYFRIRPDPDPTGSITVGSGQIRILTGSRDFGCGRIRIFTGSGSGCNLIRIKAELQPIVCCYCLSKHRIKNIES